VHAPASAPAIELCVLFWMDILTAGMVWQHEAGHAQMSIFLLKRTHTSSLAILMHTFTSCA
jgi:hypothetical protein